MGKLALVDEYGAFLSAREGRFRLLVRDESGRRVVKWELAPVEVDAIVFAVRGASISASAILLASEFGIDLVFLDGDRPVARLLPATYGSTMRNWLYQLKAHEDDSKRAELARLFVEGKIYNQRRVLLEHAKRARASGKPLRVVEKAADKIDGLLISLEDVKTAEEAALVEAQAARLYWRAVGNIIPGELGFKGRITRSRAGEGPVDPFNRALNIGYAALKREVWRAVFLAGLNPYLGFLHKPRAGKMALVFDLMEEFRPVCVDRPLIRLARGKPQVLRMFELGREQEAVVEVWRAVVNYMKKAKTPYPNLILKQARLLAMHLRGTARYKPYKARW